MIGVFDSGVGGLTVLKSLLEYLPNYDYIYLGDNNRAPYGNKTKKQVYQYTCEAVDFLFGQGCNLIIIACNTASALALRKIQQEYLPKKYPGKKILGVVRPMAEAIADLKEIKKIGVIGTRATINSKIYHDEIKFLNPGLKIISKSAPLLAPLIESNKLDETKTIKILIKYLEPFKKAKVDVLVLGCTHYPYLEEKIIEIMGKNCQVYNSGDIIAHSLKNYLKKHNELKFRPAENKEIKFYTTGDIENFKNLGKRFLGERIKNIKKIKI